MHMHKSRCTHLRSASMLRLRSPIFMAHLLTSAMLRLPANPPPKHAQGSLHAPAQRLNAAAEVAHLHGLLANITGVAHLCLWGGLAHWGLALALHMCARACACACWRASMHAGVFVGALGLQRATDIRVSRSSEHRWLF